MSFARFFNDEIRHLGPLFAAAEEADREFHRAWKEGLANLGAGPYKQTDRYRETIERFHDATQAIDRIVMTALVQAKLGELAQVPSLFAYISLPGRYFRSGYQRAAVWRFLKQLPLDEEQSNILRGIVLRQVEAAGPEFQEIARAARRVDCRELRDNVDILARRSEKEYVRQRANRLLAQLELNSR